MFQKFQLICKNLLQPKREDSGTYTIFAQNQHGKASVNCRLEVMDKPGRPASVGKKQIVTFEDVSDFY